MKKSLMKRNPAALSSLPAPKTHERHELNAPAYAPSPIPALGALTPEATPWWSERLLLLHLSGLELLRLYTRPAAIVQ